MTKQRFLRCYRGLMEAYRMVPELAARQLREILIRVSGTRLPDSPDQSESIPDKGGAVK